MTANAAVARLLRHVTPTGKNECWPWTGPTTFGYGKLHINGRTVRAHRLAYETWVKPIPDGLTIDHLCRNRSCVNPNHLEPVTDEENTRRAVQARRAERASPTNHHALPGTFRQKSGAYAARGKRNSVRYHLGTFPTMEEAHAAYTAWRTTNRPDASGTYPGSGA